MSYSIQNVAHQFDTIFSTGGFGTGDLLRKAQAMQNAIRSAGWTAAQTQAVFEQLCTQATNAGQAANAAAGAQGMLSAQQANAQLSYVMTQQLGMLQEQAAAADRVQTGFVMMQITERQQGHINAEHWLDGFGAAGYKGPREGQGITLP
jgi:predicted aspartyl protease